MQNELNKREEFLGITVKKAVVSYSPEPFWQHMLYDEMQELFPRECAEFCVTSLALNVLECDLAVVIRNNILLTDYTTVEVSR